MENEEKSKPRILSVEDNKEEQKFLSFYLRRNFVVDIVESADSFFEKFDQNKYDLALIDISIRGEISGIDIISAIRTRGNNIPIVVLSAHAYAGEKKLAYEAGANEFIVKPAPKDLLMETLLNVLEQTKSETY